MSGDGFRQLLGEGMSGVVRVSHDGLTAVKKFRSQDNLLHELDIQQRCAHIPAVTSVVGHDTKKLELRMERLAPNTLGRIVVDAKRSPVTADLVRLYRDTWVEQLKGTLRAIHAAGVVHHDFKPKNIGFRRTDPGDPRCTTPDFAQIVVFDWDLADTVGPGDDWEKLETLNKTLMSF
jgi:serine/threonine protein kinase